jgi:hypothetical protein
MREVTRKKRFVDAHVLVGVDGFSGLTRKHPVDQQEGVAMWQMPDDLVYVHCIQDVFPINSSVFSSSAMTQTTS